MNKVEYIGDGVYAEWDGFAVICHTERYGMRHYIYFEPQVLTALNAFYYLSRNQAKPEGATQLDKAMPIRHPGPA